MADSNNVSRRRFLQATGGAAAAAALAGCGGSGNTTTNGGNKTTSGTTTSSSSGGNQLHMVESTVTTFDPIAATDTESGRVIQQMFDCLMQYPQALPSVKKELAKDFTVSDDFTTYTFTLEDATYHNGDKLKASDFEYAWERLAASDHSRRAYFILDSIGVKHETKKNSKGKEVYKPGTLGVTAKDASTLQVELKSPFHATKEMLAYTSFAPIPEGIVGDIQGYDGKIDYNTFASSKPIGTGPYKLNHYSKGTEVLLDRFDGYYGTKGASKQLHWQIIEDPNALYEYVMNKNADLTISFPTSKYDPSKVQVDHTTDAGQKVGKYGPVRNGDTMNYVGVPTLNTYYIGFNMKTVPKPVRQAFAYALNQQQMVQQVFKGRGNPAYYLTPPTIYPGGAKAAEKKAKSDYPYGYNESQLDKARKVMEKAGYSKSNKFEIQWTQYDSNTWESMAKILRDQLASAHIDMKIQKAPFSTILQRGRNGQLEAYTLGWIADWPAPDNFLQLLNPPQTDTSKSGPVSYINWTPDNGDAAQKATDAYKKVLNNPAPTDSAQQARNDAYVSIEEANWEDVGFLNVYNGLSELFYYDNVNGIKPFGGMGWSRYKLNEISSN